MLTHSNKSPMRLFLSFFLLLFAFPVLAQDEVVIKIKLLTMSRTPHVGQVITLTDTSSGKQFVQTTDATGNTRFDVPVNAIYKMTTPLYSREKIIASGNVPGRTINREISFDADMRQQEQKMAMPESDKQAIQLFVKTLPDTTFYRASESKLLKPDLQWVLFEIELRGIDNLPLSNEAVTFTGRNSKKSFSGKTNAQGKITMRLPKCDFYTINFKYHPNYHTQEVSCLKSLSDGSLTIQYVGTAEYLRRKKEEEERIAEQILREERERKEREAEARRAGMTPEEAEKDRIYAAIKDPNNFEDPVIMTVLERNRNWKNKLIVCDVTGSMSGYLTQVLAWAEKHKTDDPNRQFVLFNDRQAAKELGKTNNWLYLNSKNIDTLVRKALPWHHNGGGGAYEENNIEALVMAQKIAKEPFTEVVLIADNTSPVVDMAFLPELVKLGKPIHIILCGTRYRKSAEPDYLAIAHATKGSVHTIESDIGNLGYMQDNADVIIFGQKYRIIKGEFYEVK
jgi:hypothetical protein